MPDPRALIELRELYRQTSPGDLCEIAFAPDVSRDWRADLVTGAGFVIAGERDHVRTTLERQRSLADTVAPNMTVLVVGLNPSPASADSGIGFARPGNRFWPAMLAAGLVTIDRDPLHALEQHGVGMTDLVKRTTRRASELSPEEFTAGTARVERLIEWLQPPAILFVGLIGWRTVIDRKAIAGWQPESFGGRPVYLMPSTSGLNASSQLPDFVEHLRATVSGL